MAIDTIAQTFGLPVEQEPANLPVEVKPIVQVEDDKELAKDTYRRLLRKSEDALDEMVEIAKSTEHPRAFEVAKQLIDSTANLAKQLADLSKIEEPKASQTTHIANAQTVVFAGTPAELLARMKQGQLNDKTST